MFKKNIKEIIIVSTNKGKINETQEILKDFKIIPIQNLNKNIEIEENANTFQENAVKKAETIAKYLDGKKCIADDSGIEIEYLNGFPGVHTKRWFKGTDRERNIKLIEKLNGVEKENRKVKFTVAIAVSNGKHTICETGTINGFIAQKPRGENGFGFDEIFELENGKTLAELSQTEKNQISPRKIALEKVCLHIDEIDIMWYNGKRCKFGITSLLHQEENI